MLGLEDRPLGLERREVGEREHVPEAGQRGALALDLRRLRGVLAQHADGLRVVEDVRDVSAASCSA